MMFSRCSQVALAAVGFVFVALPNQTNAAVLLSDNFDSVPSGSNLNGRALPTNVLNTNKWTATTATFLADGSGSLSANSELVRAASIDLGASFLSNNPGLYSLSLTITQPTLSSPGNSWIGLGFAAGNTIDSNLVGNNGAPWTLHRLSGPNNYYAGPNTSGQLTNASGLATVSQTTGVPHTYRLDLDTRPANWTLNAFVDGVQVDINGTSTAGSTFTYTAGNNPTLSRYLMMSTGKSNDSGVGSVDNFLFEGPVPVPEPTAGLALVGAAGLLMRRRRRA